MSLIDPPVPDDETTLAERTIAALAGMNPDWTESEGGVEETIAEAVAAPVATAAYVVRESMRSAYADIVGRVARVGRETAAPATATVTIELNTAAGLTLPAGEEISLGLNGDLEPFELTAPVTFAPTVTVQTGVAITAVTAGSAINGASGPAEWTHARISSVSVTSSAAGGTDEESDDDFIARIERAAQRMSFAPVATPDYAQAALDDAEVVRCAWKHRFSPTISGDAPGNVTLWPFAADGGPVTEACKTRLSEKFSGVDQPLGVTVNIADLQEVNVDVAISVELASGYTEAQATDAIEAALSSRITGTVWDYDPTAPGLWAPTVESVTAFDAAAAVDDLPELKRVTACTVNGTSSVSLTGTHIKVPVIGTVTVTFV